MQFQLYEVSKITTFKQITELLLSWAGGGSGKLNLVINENRTSLMKDKLFLDISYTTLTL